MPPPAEGAARSLRERKKARTRATIQAHALQLFRQRGYRGTTIEQIIDAAEVSETTLFRYFPTKEDLVLRDDFDPVIFEALLEQPGDVPPLRAIRAAFRSFFAGVTAEQRTEMHERLALVVTEPSLRAAMFDQHSQTMERLADVLATRPDATRDRFRALTVAGAAIGALMAAMSALREDPSADLPELVDNALGYLEELESGA
ncbi:TetR family transcriptional regulator [Rhodococcus triatomae]|uniref:DNA-binding transcriptional regulator, AcrR family n=1 Tax=Rhodococcus triatomae TaxID=300028 RepID=A0A1G8QHY3_9NOCA|nr:TetR family transcriptional regulator [Rhodococcus triatomae]QNG20667.1 TetR family transcriptional regulator [Rhodococcus triatomae]QNG23415.1 TetR family transcriptional regulator [Rhodococcus triatomae]SDJ04203.1 DNA-binding transcriptional regulator, AcrR family [Rhodococcus triatomae]